MDQLPLFNKKEIGADNELRFELPELSELPEKKEKSLSDTPRTLKKSEQKKPVNPMEKIYSSLIENFRKYFQKHNFQTAIVGLSGGIDSSLTLKIAVDALGCENVIGVLMPEIGLTSKENIDHAKQLAEILGVKTYYQPINTILIDFKLVSWNPSPLAMMNIRARIRAVLLYSLANTLNGLVLGTSNKSEIMLGYGTKYGDLAADIEVIGTLYKTQVYELARYLKFSDVLMNKPPSAELKPNHTDEEELGASYRDLDNILQKIEEGLTVEDLIDRGINPTLVHRVSRLVATNKHKREMPPILKVE
ncbi:NAD+ synthase [Candidatus Peregrinibacteria bacterium]|nr:NAD+ synthase [Candidatus Peregrinibacteria bacterium]